MVTITNYKLLLDNELQHKYLGILILLITKKNIFNNYKLYVI